MRISDWSSDVCSSDLAVERVALDDRNLETKLVERDIHQGIFRCVLTRETDHDRSRHPAVRNPPAELGSSCVMRVEVPLGGVHRQMSQDYCLVFTDRLATRMTHLLPGSEVLEVVVGAREMLECHAAGFPRR